MEGEVVMTDEDVMRALWLIRENILSKHADNKITSINIHMKENTIKIDVTLTDWHVLNGNNKED